MDKEMAKLLKQKRCQNDPLMCLEHMTITREAKLEPPPAGSRHRSGTGSTSSGTSSGTSRKTTSVVSRRRNRKLLVHVPFPIAPISLMQADVFKKPQTPSRAGSSTPRATPTTPAVTLKSLKEALAEAHSELALEKAKWARSQREAPTEGLTPDQQRNLNDLLKDRDKTLPEIASKSACSRRNRNPNRNMHTSL